MPRRRGHVARGELASLGLAAQQIAEASVEHNRTEAGVVVEVDVDLSPRGDFGQPSAQGLFHLDRRALGIMPDIGVQPGDRGYRAARVGGVLNPRRRGASARLGGKSDLLDRQDRLCRSGQAVAAAVHGGRTDMARFAGHNDLEIACMHGAGDDADVGIPHLHDRPLLDMRLQPAGPSARARV